MALGAMTETPVLRRPGRPGLDSSRLSDRNLAMLKLQEDSGFTLEQLGRAFGLGLTAVKDALSAARRKKSRTTVAEEMGEESVREFTRLFGKDPAVKEWLKTGATRARSSRP